MLAWAPAFSLEEALGETIGWYRQFIAGQGKAPLAA
jgi:hypothetical protein